MNSLFYILIFSMLYFCTFFECRGDNVTEEYKIIETIYQDLKAKTPDTARYNEAHLLFNKYIKTPYARKFLKLCEETQLEETDYKYRSILEFNYFRLHHFYFNLDSCNYYLNRLRNISYQANDFRNYFTAYKSILDMFTSRGDYDFVLIQTRQMLIEAQMVESQWGAIFAHLTEATVHRFRKKYSRAIECYKKAIALAEIDVVTKSSIMTQMANCYLKLEDYDNAYNLLVQNEILLDNISKKFPQLDARYRSKIFELQVYFAKYYYQIEELENMNKYLTLAKERYSKNIFPSYLMLYHELSAIYYDINNEPNKALVEINKALGFFKKDEQPYYRAQLETKKGEYLSRLELYAEAIYAYENALMTNDFLNTEMLKNQEKIYKENYKIEQALLKKESHKTYFHIFLLILLIILFVFAILFLKKYIFLTKNLSRSRKNIINAKNEAEEANHLQTEFLNYVRNQLNTPLSVVVSNSRILTKNNDISDTERINLSSQIENNSCILIDIVNSVLELSRLESGKIIFNIRKYDLISLCKEIENDFIFSENNQFEIIRNGNTGYIPVMIDKLHFCKILKTLFLIAKRENSGSRIVYNIDFKEKKRFVFISFDVNDEYFSNNIQHELIKAMLYRMDCSYRLVDNDGKKCIVIELLNELYQKELLLEYN